MDRKEHIVVGAAVALVFYVLILGFLGPVVTSALKNRTISNTGSVEAIGLGVYWDQACTSSVSSISWGVVEPGSSVDKTVFIRNEGNAVCTLSLSTSNWSPSNASDSIALTWDYGGQTLNVNDVVQVKLTLSVSSNVAGITDFTFDITIAAIE